MGPLARRCRFLVSCLAAACLLFDGRIAANPSSTADTLRVRLALPESPGAIALLVEHGEHPEAVARVRQALRSPRADVRAVAARVALAANLVDLAPDIHAALKAERHDEAAAELVRAMVVLGSGDVIGETVGLAVAAGPLAAYAAAEIVARRLGPGLLRFVTAFVDTEGVPRIDLGLPLAIAAARSPAGSADVVAVAVRFGGYRRQVLLTFLTHAATWIDDNTIVGLLESDQPDVRTTTAWWLVARAQHGTKPSLPVLAVLEAQAPGGVAQNWDSFAREMVRRAAGLPRARVQWKALFQAPVNTVTRELYWAPDVAKLLTRDEARLLKAPLARVSKWSRSAWDVQHQEPEGWTAAYLRLVQHMPPGLIGDLEAATGCVPPDGTFLHRAEVTFSGDGRVSTFGFRADAQSAECRLFIRTLVRLTVARPDDIVMRPRQTLGLPVGRRPLECLAGGSDAGRWLEDASRIAESEVVMPKVVRSVPPIYIQGAQDARIEGKVLLDVVISAGGCVSDARVVQPLHAELDAEALRSVLLWEFTPGRLDDRPVPVRASIEVAFRLYR